MPEMCKEGGLGFVCVCVCVFVLQVLDDIAFFCGVLFSQLSVRIFYDSGP